MSTIKTTTLSTQGGSTVPVDTVVNGTAKAWVNFNGTGVVAIRRAFNVSSISDNGTGNYTVNFTTAMPDANYEASTNATNGTGVAVDDQRCFTSTPSGSYLTTSFKIGVLTAANNAFQDASVINIAIFS